MVYNLIRKTQSAKMRTNIPRLVRRTNQPCTVAPYIHMETNYSGDHYLVKLYNYRFFKFLFHERLFDIDLLTSAIILSKVDEKAMIISR